MKPKKIPDNMRPAPISIGVREQPSRGRFRHDPTFVMVFLAVVGIVVVSLFVSCISAFHSGDLGLIKNLNDAALAVFRYGCVAIVSLLAGRMTSHKP